VSNRVERVTGIGDAHPTFGRRAHPEEQAAEVDQGAISGRGEHRDRLIEHVAVDYVAPLEAW